MGIILAALVGILAGLWSADGCGPRDEDTGAGGSFEGPGLTVAPPLAPIRVRPAPPADGADLAPEAPTVATPTGEGGAGGAPAPCQPAPCAPNQCGEQDDGCGGVIVCAPCCSPFPAAEACAGKCGVPVPDGCGGTIDCDEDCGDWAGMMHCGADGLCHCTDPATLPGFAVAMANCNPGGGSAHLPAYCGGKSHDAPPACNYAAITVLEAGADLWCCSAP